MPRTTNYDPLRVNKKARSLIQLGRRQHGSPYLNTDFELPKCSRCPYTEFCPSFNPDANTGDCPPYKHATLEGVAMVLEDAGLEATPTSTWEAKRFQFWAFHTTMARIGMNRNGQVFVPDGEGVKLSKTAEAVMAAEKHADGIMEMLRRHGTPRQAQEIPFAERLLGKTNGGSNGNAR